MRALLWVALAVLACGCMSGQPAAKPDDAKMNQLFGDAIDSSRKNVKPVDEVSTTVSLPPIETQTTRTTTAVTVRTTATTSPTTTVEKTVSCGDIDHPMGQIDCNKGYCTETGLTCGYIPGSLNAGSGKCVCRKPKAGGGSP
jgi:hypothetical protein